MQKCRKIYFSSQNFTCNIFSGVIFFFFLQGNLVEALRPTQQLTVLQIKRTQIIATITTTAVQGSNHLSNREAVARKAVCTELEKQERYIRAPADTKRGKTKVNTDKICRKIYWMCILTLTWRALSIYDTASAEYVFISLWLLDRFKPLFEESLSNYDYKESVRAEAA